MPHVVVSIPPVDKARRRRLIDRYRIRVPAGELLVSSDPITIIVPTALRPGGEPAPPPTFVVGTSTSTWDGVSNGVQAGDIIEIEGGSRGALRLNNIIGASGNHVIIRSDPTQQVVIANATSQDSFFTFVIDDSKYFTLDGSTTLGETYGFKVTTTANGDNPTSYLQIWGTCTDYELGYVEIDGQWLPNGSGLGQGGIGLQHNDHAIVFGSQWRENIRVHHFYVHDILGEGMYLGPNYPNNAAALRNIELNNNIVWDCGRDNIQLKSAIEGTNSIHHNDCRRSGLRTDETIAGQQDGISCFEGYASIYNNYVEAAGEVGIRMNTNKRPNTFGPFPVQDIYNNVIWKTGVASTAVSQPGDGIRIDVSSGMALLGANTYQNTIVTTENNGIWHTGFVLAADVRDNIVCDWGNNDITTPAAVTETNNRTGTIASQNFANAGGGDFHLTASSPARNSGSQSGFPATDHDGVARPQGPDADQGAFEIA